MNQSVIFTDTLEFISGNYVEFVAQNMGVNIPCRVSVEQLCKLSGNKIETEAQAIEIAETLRFDLEECFEEKIDAEDFDDNGIIHF